MNQVDSTQPEALFCTLRGQSHQALNALPDNIAVIDADGTIVAVNDAWRSFAKSNGGDLDALCDGANYLVVCDRAAAAGNADAAAAAAMIRAVAAGNAHRLRHEYPCHAPGEKRWFELTVTVMSGSGPLRMLLAHENITPRKLAEQKLRLQAHLLASVEQAVIATDLSGAITYWNPFAEKMYGWAAQEVIGRNIVDVTPSTATREQASEIMAQLVKGESWAGIFEVRTRTGQVMPVRVTDSPIRDDHGQLIGISGISSDITEQRQVEQALHLAAMVYQAIGEAIMVIDAQQCLVAVNPAFTQLTGFSEAEVHGRAVEMLLPELGEPLFASDLQRALEKTGHWQGRVQTRCRNGQRVQHWLMLDTIYDQPGHVSHRVGMFSPITDQKLAEATIWHQANFDALTGLPNRSMFCERLEHAMQTARRTTLPLALMFIDLDHFKEINDTLGHDLGDLLLQEAARRLSHCVRRIDTVARLGGDEFTVILTELADACSVERIAATILASLARPFHLNLETIHLSASMGITLFPADAAQSDVLLTNADQAMYAAKTQGRNRFQYFTPQMQQKAHARMRLARDLRDAVAQNQFNVAYQPIVELATGRILKAEALVRWQHPQLGALQPASFIPIAEDTGIIGQISEWVCDRALEQALLWRAAGDATFQISVNVSPIEFRDGRIQGSRWFQGLRHVAGAESMVAALVVEITEGLLLDASAGVVEQLRRLREAGVQIAIDDFGTGYSALSYLRRFHIDYLKIDQSFVRKMTAHSDDFALCEAIIVMGHRLGIKVIAEGVETEEQRLLLATAGCDYAQGYLLGRPVEAAQFNVQQWVAASAAVGRHQPLP